MKARFTAALVLAVGLTLPPTLAKSATTNNVTGGNNIDYTINTQADPAFTLVRGNTYLFQLSGIALHPFWIKSALDGNFAAGASAYNTGVVNNGTTSGTLTFTVPTNAPSQLFYQCGNHAAMSGTLTIINPPTPPPFVILSVTASNNIRLRHTGTNIFAYTPEFVTNLVSTNWVTLVVLSNTFSGGTNDVYCGKPSGNPVFIRVRAK